MAITETNQQYYQGAQGFRGTGALTIFTTTFNTDLIFKAFAPTSANYALNNFKLYTSPSGISGTFTEYISAYTVVDNKITILEHVSGGTVNNEKIKDTVLAEFKSYDKDLRTLTYHVLLENFNTKYDNLNIKQKLILKEFINSADNGPILKKFFNKEIINIKQSLKEHTSKTLDKATKIKLEEIDKLIVEINKRTSVKSKHLVDLLQYHSLLEELNITHE